MQAKVKVVVYTPANMNAIDGSSIWAQSITLALAGIAEIDVTLLLGHAITNQRILGPLLRHPEISVIEATRRKRAKSDSLSLDEAATLIVRMRRRGADVVLVRGAEAAARLAREPLLQGRLLPYLTDIPQRIEEIDDTAQELMGRITAASPVILCQTEELRLFLEANFSSARGKGWVLPPTIPEGLSPHVLAHPTSEDLRLCYAGKFARDWNTLEMCDLPTELGERGIRARLTMVGDKINQDPTWPLFVTEMKNKLETSPGVEWVGGVSREAAIDYMSSAHVGLSWRSPELDHSLELSTKLLEYCAVGTPPLLNRTEMHERIFGVDYPLLVDPGASVPDLLRSLTHDPGIYAEALDRIAAIPTEYTLDKTRLRLSKLLGTIFSGDVPTRRKRRIMSLFPGHSS